MWQGLHAAQMHAICIYLPQIYSCESVSFAWPVWVPDGGVWPRRTELMQKVQTMQRVMQEEPIYTVKPRGGHKVRETASAVVRDPNLDATALILQELENEHEFLCVPFCFPIGHPWCPLAACSAGIAPCATLSVLVDALLAFGAKSRVAPPVRCLKFKCRSLRCRP